jgi:hypothetical protein
MTPAGKLVTIIAATKIVYTPAEKTRTVRPNTKRATPRKRTGRLPILEERRNFETVERAQFTRNSTLPTNSINSSATIVVGFGNLAWF